MAVRPGPRALVLLPTRELAVQVHDVLAPLAEAVGCGSPPSTAAPTSNGRSPGCARASTSSSPRPGRLIDLGDRGELSVADVETLVLDEADRMADMGFMPQVEWVLRRLERPHQTLLFSATLDGAVDRLVTRYLTDPVLHEVVSSTQTVAAMEHRFLQVHQMDKVKVAAAICRAQEKVARLRPHQAGRRPPGRAARQGGHPRGRDPRRPAPGQPRAGADRLLLGQAPRAGCDRRRRPRAAHRGVDIVVHYDPPEDQKAYLHRSGRTARAGETGVVVTLALWNQVVEAEVIQRRLGLRIPIVEMFSNDPRLADLAAWEPVGRRERALSHRRSSSTRRSIPPTSA